jgi:hypothetical protein
MRRLRTTLVVAGLGALTLWPAVHLALCLRYDVSPWKLAGWGMYATPRPRTIGMEVYGRGAGDPTYRQLTAPSPLLRSEAAEFLERWRWLGRLAAPKRFVAALFAAEPAWDELRLELYRSHLDPATGMVGLRRDDRHYRRADGPRAGPEQASQLLTGGTARSTAPAPSR